MEDYPEKEPSLKKEFFFNHPMGDVLDIIL